MITGLVICVQCAEDWGAYTPVLLWALTLNFC